MADASSVKYEQSEHRSIREPIVPIVADEVGLRTALIGKRLPRANYCKHWR